MTHPSRENIASRMAMVVPERAKLHIVMTAWQFGYAGNHIILRTALNMGVSKLVFPLYRNVVALLLLAPSAYFLEKDRPPLTTSLLIQFFLLGFIGITCNQGSYLFGLDNTSPSLASAIENAIPAVTFLMAAALRIERVNLNRKDGIAKVLGTLASVSGASVITLYKGPAIYTPDSRLHQSHILVSLGDDAEGKNWTLGCVYLIAHCICWSGWIVLQAPVLKKYPARLSAISYYCFFSVLQFLVIAVYYEKDPRAWKVHSSAEAFSIFYTGAVASALAFAVQTWVIDRAGPVFASVYLPVQTILVAVIASVVLGEEFYLGGMIGAVLIVAGLYLVVWGKGEESKFAEEKAAIPSVSENNQREDPCKSSLIQPLLSFESDK